MYEVMKAISLATNNIDEKVKQLEEYLGAKGAKSYEEYCELCGEIKGLLTARKFLTDLTRNMESLDE